MGANSGGGSDGGCFSDGGHAAHFSLEQSKMFQVSFKQAHSSLKEFKWVVDDCRTDNWYSQKSQLAGYMW